jgi:hypothetical protein
MRYLVMLLYSIALMGAPICAQEPEQPHVVLKPAQEREARDNPTMALTPGAEPDKGKRPAGNSAEQVQEIKKRSAEWLKTCVVALVLGSSTIVAEAQSFTNTSRGGGSTSTLGIGAIAAPRPSTTLSSPPASSLRSVGVISAPLPSATTSPSSVIGRPLNQLNQGTTPLNQADTLLTTPIAPLIPIPTVDPNTLTTGGSSGVPLQGGGRDTLESCIGFWDRATHMTKAEWKVACQRSIVHRDEIQKAYQKSR